ncbi:ribosome biogenesis GTPase Der [Sodalis endosymbiont of Henestaris halophilus]|uniref:ribosome biogenesis GTPase Der n=1 Tax=Sodalis endosymbiont of Henestaris halophilus TaxID=1929246 RepID=UPI000BBF5E8D|nr:ribosome biogenesis GTPase Der [Sodalis endosymbiont of Henestaris halophilus]SNC58925.1 GTPase Der [Sodalis endosymbiont of Henestaris halophilus]
MTPVVALIGRQNVGKSTLFNRLTCIRDALMADIPGLTRDRKYGRAEWEGHKFIVIDTGGINGMEEGVEVHIAKQSMMAIEEADIVLFIVDGRAGLMAADKDIAIYLRRRQKTTVIVVNKIDGIDVDSAVGDFYALGMSDIVPIAALHGHGISNLLKNILLQFLSNGLLINHEDTLESLPDDKKEVLTQEEKHFEPHSLPIKLAIVGRPNVGKSTLINRILGEYRVVVYNMPGTTRDSIYIPMVRDEREYILIDTAGVRKSSMTAEKIEKFSIIKTLQAIENANVVLLVIDALEGISDQDLSLLNFIVNNGRALVIVFNKWDGLSKDMQSEVKEVLNHRLDFINFARVNYISAMNGYGINSLFESINEAYQCATKRVSTTLLTRIMRMAVDEHQPPLVRGRRVKPKYAHAGGYNPPIVIIHGTQVKALPDSYKRYLINYFRRSLKIMGTPIRIQFHEAINPFVGRCRSITHTQQRKCNHLISHIKKK